MKNWWIISVSFLLMSGALCADIQSTSGNIDFDTQSNNDIDFTIGSSGLGIATLTPAANLHVSGNAAIENGNVGVGASPGVSTLEVSGSLGFSIEKISTNTILSGNSVILADTSSSNINLTLPDAINHIGRIYTIKKMSANNRLFIGSAGNIDGFSEISLASASTGFPHVRLMASGNREWQILSISGNGGLAPSDNLVAWFRMDETSGNAIDSSPSGLEGDLNGGFTFASNSTGGQIGSALDFDGDDDRIEVSNTNAALTFSSNSAYTYMAWINLKANTSYPMVTSRGGGQDELRMLSTTLKPEFVMGSQFITAPAAINLNTWYHLAGVFDGDQIHIYVDGDLKGSSGGGTYTISSTLHIGSRSGAFLFTGTIDDVRVYSKALSGAEIQDVISVSR